MQHHFHNPVINMNNAIFTTLRIPHQNSKFVLLILIGTGNSKIFFIFCTDTEQKKFLTERISLEHNYIVYTYVNTARGNPQKQNQ